MRTLLTLASVVLALCSGCAAPPEDPTRDQPRLHHERLGVQTQVTDELARLLDGVSPGEVLRRVQALVPFERLADLQVTVFEKDGQDGQVLMSVDDYAGDYTGALGAFVEGNEEGWYYRTEGVPPTAPAPTGEVIFVEEGRAHVAPLRLRRTIPKGSLILFTKRRVTLPDGRVAVLELGLDTRAAQAPEADE